MFEGFIYSICFSA